MPTELLSLSHCKPLDTAFSLHPPPPTAFISCLVHSDLKPYTFDSQHQSSQVLSPFYIITLSVRKAARHEFPRHFFPGGACLGTPAARAFPRQGLVYFNVLMY